MLHRNNNNNNQLKKHITVSQLCIIINGFGIPEPSEKSQLIELLRNIHIWARYDIMGIFQLNTVNSCRYFSLFFGITWMKVFSIAGHESEASFSTYNCFVCIFPFGSKSDLQFIPSFIHHSSVATKTRLSVSVSPALALQYHSSSAILISSNLLRHSENTHTLSYSASAWALCHTHPHTGTQELQKDLITLITCT